MGHSGTRDIVITEYGTFQEYGTFSRTWDIVITEYGTLNRIWDIQKSAFLNMGTF